MQTALFTTPAPQIAQMPFCVIASDRNAAKEITALHYSIHPTLFGDALIASTESGICAIHFTDTGENLLETLAQQYPKAVLKAAYLPEHLLAAGWISGNLPPKTVALHLSGSPFQLQVWQALLEVPAGQTTTYGQLATRLGLSATAARAVGTAVGQNAIAVLIPCHRVVGSTGKLTGFRWGVERKKQLLLAEMNS